jgi:pyruvate/2-oxoglutarate dehydrogenase complex dihydrolipoamide acyltransferase (E2) component
MRELGQPMAQIRHDLVLPDLGFADDVRVTASVWLAPVGKRVIEGERLLEVLAGEVTVDLPAPANGVLAERCVAEDDPLRTGQVLGVIVER